MPGGRYPREGVEFSRAVTFYDAIYAFAVTLLITTVDDFSPEAWSGPAALWAANGPSLLAFTISFAVVVSFWRGSHAVVSGLAAMNGRVIGLGCIAMFGVVLLPFATEALGKISGEPLPVAVYAVVIAGTSLMHNLVEDQATAAGLGHRRRSPAERRWFWVGGAVVPAVFLLSIPIAYLVAPSPAMYFSTGLIVVGPLAGRGRARRMDAPARAAGTVDPDPADPDPADPDTPADPDGARRPA
ncbi:TMEM175 family protein [Nakamurella sp.]|uniref:TMEM175 family protein n=1 Tax=Nakamurella sp. TaxID=1869182 RepID=UPI003B3AB35C